MAYQTKENNNKGGEKIMVVNLVGLCYEVPFIHEQALCGDCNFWFFLLFSASCPKCLVLNYIQFANVAI